MKSPNLTVASATALTRCGEGVIDYTRGVLDALGYEDLSARVGFAHGAYRAAIKARKEQLPPVDTTTFASMLESSDRRADDVTEARVDKTRAELTAVFAEVDAIRETAIEFMARATE